MKKVEGKNVMHLFVVSFPVYNHQSQIFESKEERAQAESQQNDKRNEKAHPGIETNSMLTLVNGFCFV